MGRRVVRGVTDSVRDRFSIRLFPEPVVNARCKLEEWFSDESVALSLLVTAPKKLLSGDAVHLRAVYGWRIFDGANKSR